MVFSKVLASLFAMALVVAVNANLVASPEAGALSGVRRACTKTYTVVAGDYCEEIETMFGITDAELHAWNPSINSGCTNLQIGQILCVGMGSASSCQNGILQGPFGGKATYYWPNGGTGACPPYPVINNGDMAVAISLGNWNNGAYCGKTMIVTYGSKTISVIVKDLCPTCQSNEIGLTVGAMAALDPNYVQHGVDTVQWSICN
ncbi:RlpA-like double-psi beta-barrel-protein domain-containing protein-containing protein [Mycena galopus ATCC 62051]|nr:RlpA-like double-psi beta-barrel-protein domain-containing protein-containing protein [Mycena galopus ATCC 62051]